MMYMYMFWGFLNYPVRRIGLVERGPLMFLSQIPMYPCCNSFLGTIYVCLLLNVVHLAFGARVTAARKLINSIYSGFCDQRDRGEREIIFRVLKYLVTCLEKRVSEGWVS